MAADCSTLHPCAPSGRAGSSGGVVYGHVDVSHCPRAHVGGAPGALAASNCAPPTSLPPAACPGGGPGAPRGALS
eukprot:4734765-Pyramimonas_sp.AAC.1